MLSMFYMKIQEGGIKKKMRKMWRSRKALSPVVAAIILIAVTVAVSIAVAAWMGALSFTFMATEQIAFTGISWDLASNNCTLTVKNTGTAILTMDKVKINNNVIDAGNWTVTGADATLDANEEVNMVVTYDYEAGDVYAFTIITAKNNPFGPYTATAPG